MRAQQKESGMTRDELVEKMAKKIYPCPNEFILKGVDLQLQVVLDEIKDGGIIDWEKIEDITIVLKPEFKTR